MTLPFTTTRIPPESIYTAMYELSRMTQAQPGSWIKGWHMPIAAARPIERLADAIDQRLLGQES